MSDSLFRQQVADVEIAEITVSCANFVEPHLVDQLLEFQHVIREEHNLERSRMSSLIVIQFIPNIMGSPTNHGQPEPRHGDSCPSWRELWG